MTSPDGEAFARPFTIFQPVGGMQRVGDGFGNAVKHLVRLNSKVTAIQQSDKGLTVNYVDTRTGAKMTASAD
jgi:monoamine oxidase